MAVFTPVTEAELKAWLQDFDVGTLVSMRPISDGIENTNYFVDTVDAGTGTGTRHHVLTLIERIAPEALPFYLRLLKHLAVHGIACPDPAASRQGELSRPLNGKPATLVSRLPGSPRLQPDAADVRAVAALLARMHLAAADFGSAPPNPRGLAWWPEAASRLRSVVAADQAALIDDELRAQQRFAQSAQASRLPRSAVHADLFRDNVLFDDDGSPGAIDFFFACEESWMFDLAVVCNDWCLGSGEDDAQLDATRVHAMWQGYLSVRDISGAELEAWPLMLRAAALRFWLSRLIDLHFPRPAAVLRTKDPAPFERILRARREHLDETA